MKNSVHTILSVLLLILGLFAAWPTAAEPGPKVLDLSASLEPLKASFNQHKDEPRFIALLSPT